MVGPRLICQFISVLAAALFHAAALAQTVVFGAVEDAVTAKPVIGANVQIEYSGQPLAAGVTDENGGYRIPLIAPANLPRDAQLMLKVSSSEYAPAGKSFQLIGVGLGKIGLYRTNIAGCLSRSGRAVIVGNFLPPAGARLSDFSKRIAMSLEFALITQLQTAQLKLDPMPSFEACEAAQPQSLRLGSQFAKALRADAFVAGEIASNAGMPNYTISMWVSDASGFFATPAVAANPGVNLENPSGATVSSATYAAVLASIAAGLASNGKCVDAITVIAVAERLSGTPPSYLTELRDRCRAQVPNVGLRRTP